MAFYLKKHMIIHDYTWTAYPNNDPHISGVPDNTLFNKSDGYQVLYMINHFGKTYQQVSIRSGKKIEFMIRKIPAHIRTQTDVQRWLFDKW